MRDRLGPVVLLLLLLASLSTPARATSLVRARTAPNVDWVSAGVGGVDGDAADIAVTGVTGTVTKALLYWDGMAIDPHDGVYDNDTVAINANPVVGTSLGDTSSNCWGTGSSTAFVADVTPYVLGDGVYTISNLMSQLTHQVNGASLVVLFDDGNPANNHDLVFYEGNDSTHGDDYSGYEDWGWHAVFEDIVYLEGTLKLQLHVADGQSTADGAMTFISGTRRLDIADTASMFDGLSVPIHGTSRASGQALWDIHNVDITSLLRSFGTVRVSLTTPSKPADCTSLVVAIAETTPAPVAVCGDGEVMPPEECDDGNLEDGDCCDSTCHFEPIGTVCGNEGDVCLESLCDGAGTCDSDGAGCLMPVGARSGLLQIQLGRLQDRLTWQWRPGVSEKDDFDDPLGDTDYDFCLLDKGTGSVRLLAHAVIPGGEDCANRTCWKETQHGYQYRNPAAPLQQLVLQGGLPGQARITAKTVGKGLTLPPLPLAPPVLVRLRARDGLCWGANFSIPIRNTRKLFLSRGDYYTR